MQVAQHIDRAVSRYGRHTFASCDGRVATLEAVDARARALAGSLFALGVRKGDRVVVLLENSIECIEVDFGLARGGYVRVSLNPRVTVQEAEYIINDAEPAVAIYGASFAGMISPVLAKSTSIRHWIRVDDGVAAAPPAAPALDYGELTAAGEDAAPAMTIATEDAYCIFYTSGSSGKPKGVILSHRAIISVACNVMMEIGPRSSRDRILLLQPLSHGSAFFILACAIRGACVVLMPNFDPAGVLRLIAEQGITAIKLVPTMLHRLLESPGLEKTDLSAVRQVIYGGSHISKATLTRAMAVFGEKLIQHYGQSEAPSLLTVLPGEDHSARNAGRAMLASAGRPIATVELKIVGPARENLAPGSIGEIAVRAPHVMTGYWRRPDLTAAALADGWLYTNDAGRIDDRGYVYLLGRRDEMIISGGFNIAPKEIEDAICSHPGVREAAVMGRADEAWGHIVVAFVSVRDPAVHAAALVSHLKPLLGFKCPKIIKVIPDLPKNTNGKIDKRALALLN